MSQSRPGSWLPTPALSTAVGTIALLLLLAVTLGRQDLLLLALPMTVGTVLPLLTRAYWLPSLRVRTTATTLLEGESTMLVERLLAAESTDLVRLRVGLEGWLELPDGGADLCVWLPAGRECSFSHRLASTRWGRGRVSEVRLTATTAHGLLRADLVLAEHLALRTLPLREGFTATDLVPNATGVVGGHRSRRTGEGMDLAGLRPFAVGERLRRINWAVSTRTGQLHVTSTYSDRDTEVVLVLDTSVEIGQSNGVAASSSTIDTAVRAAASVAEHYLRNGDRVGLLDLSRAGRPIRSRTGRSQLDRLVEILLEVRVAPASELSIGRALSRISNRALVIVFSPLLSDELAGAVAQLTRTGRSVVLVDTLPAEVQIPERGEWTELAWQLQMLHRENLAGALAEHGVPVVAWFGSGSLDQVLIGLSRLAVAPRLRR
ncbi:MAG: DUF58 domain-containing protein [Jatrophihabitans sp.]